MAKDGLVVSGLTLLAGALAAPGIIKKINENEDSRLKKIRNGVGVGLGVLALGFIAGSIAAGRSDQIEQTKYLQENYYSEK